MELDTIGIDLGKTVFHLVGLNRAGEVVERRKFSRPQLLRFTANLRVRLIGTYRRPLANDELLHYTSNALEDRNTDIMPPP